MKHEVSDLDILPFTFTNIWYIMRSKKKYLPTNFDVICTYFDKLSRVK